MAMKLIKQALLLTLFLLGLCGLVYPLTMTGIAQLAFHSKANGSMLEQQGKPVASTLIGQQFTQPYFLHGRPSAVHYNTAPKNERLPVTSGAFNYSATNPALHERVKYDIEKFLQQNPTVHKKEIPLELFLASGSGLDPHISIAAAAVQIPRIAKASNLSKETIQQLITEHTHDKVATIFGEPSVNYVEVNIAIYNEMNL